MEQALTAAEKKSTRTWPRLGKTAAQAQEDLAKRLGFNTVVTCVWLPGKDELGQKAIENV